jgi:DNA-binding response OmpR family regulator
VLIVDDNVDAALMMATLLRTAGHATAIAHSGRDALSLAADFAPEVVLLDIGLPDLSGYDVARKLRSGAAAATLVALTGWGQAEDVQRAIDAGFDHHLVKPADVDQLLRLVAESRSRSPSARSRHDVAAPSAPVRIAALVRGPDSP